MYAIYDHKEYITGVDLDTPVIYMVTRSIGDVIIRTV